MVVVYNTKTPNMDVAEALASLAVEQADKAGITLQSEPDTDATEIGHFEFSGAALYGAVTNASKPSIKPDGPSFN